jgi:hypothetical protein
VEVIRKIGGPAAAKSRASAPMAVELAKGRVSWKFARAESAKKF